MTAPRTPTGTSLAVCLGMSRNQEPSHPSNRSGRQPSREDEGPEDREPEAPYGDDDGYGDANGYGDDDGDDDDGYGDDARAHRSSRLPNREHDEEEEIEIDPDLDIIQVLDEDDLQQMDGPDA